MGNVEYFKKIMEEMDKKKTKKFNKNVEKGIIGEIGIGEYFILNFHWGFHPTKKEFDFGIDGFVEVIEDNTPTSKMFAVQVKKGTTHLKGNGATNYRFEFSEEDYTYWKEQTLPVILIFDNENDGKYYWVKFDKKLIKKTMRQNNPYEIQVSTSNIFSRDKAYEKIKNIAMKPNFIADSILELERSMQIITVLLPYHFARCRKSEVRRTRDYVFFNLECYNKDGRYENEEICFMQYHKNLNQKQHLQQFTGVVITDEPLVPIEDNPFEEDAIGHNDELVDGEDYRSEGVSNDDLKASNNISEDEDENEDELWVNDLEGEEFYINLSEVAKVYPIVSEYLFGSKLEQQ
ncbi:DUF4365 domain-containing protein [Bacillus cereus]|uniref:DUF4365 domain-containing protein n=1 Tax=Bacillus cereus TaxID=1396 RepID=UPI001495FF24|nr:DUF4365 domain-containing protein [Bacillus cereus]QKE10626.1 DUF4365 domain-containing protein [Bacillus cereus]